MAMPMLVTHPSVPESAKWVDDAIAPDPQVLLDELVVAQQQSIHNLHNALSCTFAAVRVQRAVGDELVFRNLLAKVYHCRSLRPCWSVQSPLFQCFHVVRVVWTQVVNAMDAVDVSQPLVHRWSGTVVTAIHIVSGMASLILMAIPIVVVVSIAPIAPVFGEKCGGVVLVRTASLRFSSPRLCWHCVPNHCAQRMAKFRAATTLCPQMN